MNEKPASVFVTYIVATPERVWESLTCLWSPRYCGPTSPELGGWGDHGRRLLPEDGVATVLQFVQSLPERGSGAGIKRFIGKSTDLAEEDLIDFGASDAAMTDAEIAEVGRGVQLVPMTAGAVVLAYNLPGLQDDLKLTREAYSGIFLGEITKWNDPKITASHRLAFEQSLLGRQLQHQLEDGRMNLQRQAVANLRQAGMIGRVLGQRGAEKLPQRKAVAATPGNAPLRADALKIA